MATTSKSTTATSSKNSGNAAGTLGTIFRKAQNRIQDPAKLRRLVVNLIEPETWTEVDADLKGDAYEALLQRGAEDTKTGAGQYFTPRPLIRAIVACIRPRPGETIADPACGTGGFLMMSHEWIVDHHIEEMDADDKRFLRDETFTGWEIVDGTARLCAMNLSATRDRISERRVARSRRRLVEVRPRRAIRHRAHESSLRSQVVAPFEHRSRRRER